MTAEDVRPENTGAIGVPDRANIGWDTHFGYGRVNMAEAMARIANDPVPTETNWPCELADAECVPPEAQIDSPAWFAPINMEQVGGGGVAVRGDAAAPHSDAPNDISWELEIQCGQDVTDATFDADATDTIGTGSGPVTDGLLGTIPQAKLQSLGDTCNGEVTNDAGRPAGTATDAWPADPYADHSTGNPADNTDPERHAFQIRVTVSEDEDPENIGRYRKTLFAYNDDGNLPGWPKPVGSGSDAANYVTGSGGETSPRLFDLDGDNELDILQATTSGEVKAMHADGSPVTSFSGGQVSTDRYTLEKNHPVPGALPQPRESPRVPTIGDIDGDLEPEIVLTAGEHIYAWNHDGTKVDGFFNQQGEPTTGVDPALSEPCINVPKPCFNAADRRITSTNHIKRGFFGSPALADLDCDGNLDVTSGAMDQHLYAWDGDGDPLPGYPTKLRSDHAAGAEIITSPAIAELDGNGCGDADGQGGSPEIVIATNEVIDHSCFPSPEPELPDPPPPECEPELPGSFLGVLNWLLGNATGANPVYAVHGHNGEPLEDDGWPVEVGVADGDILPLVVPGHDSAVLDRDGDGNDEVSVSAGTSVQPGGTRLVDGDGTTEIPAYEDGPANSPDQGAILNLADYQSVGDILGAGTPAIVKGGLTLNGAANLLAVNQNLPFSHVEQAWDVTTGDALPGYPVATDDFQLVSQASVAKVGGPGPSRQVLVGTGLYQLHAYGPLGLDVAGWPKFTGGWQQTTPAVGDVNGNGNLDVTTLTREGWQFLWDTGTPACGGNNDEWWTFHHDEHSSNNYGHDGRPPGSPEDLIAAGKPGGGVALGWTAPGDDWLCNAEDPRIFRVIVSNSNDPIEHPSDGIDLAAQAGPGETEFFDLSAAQASGAQRVAVLYRDEARNWGLLAEGPIQNGDPDGDGLNNDVDNCPAVNNPGQEDSDGDGIGDACDPPPDSDGDNEPDATDNCPTTPNPGQEDTDGDGTGDACEQTGQGGGTPPSQQAPATGACANAVNGTRAGDRLTGTDSSDRIAGMRGRDRISGLGGDDCLFGNKGPDRVFGGLGADQISGGNKRDRLTGDAGADTIRAGNARDVVKARDGEADTIDCGGAIDRVSADPQDKLTNCENVNGVGKQSK
jgi:hypothetical protein